MQEEEKEKRGWRTEKALMRYRVELKRIIADMVRTQEESMRIYSKREKRNEEEIATEAARALLVMSEGGAEEASFAKRECQGA